MMLSSLIFIVASFFVVINVRKDNTIFHAPEVSKNYSLNTLYYSYMNIVKVMILIQKNK